MAEDRRRQHDDDGDPAERARRRPRVRRRCARRGDGGSGSVETLKRVRADERDQRRAEPAAGDGDIERGDRVGRRFEKALRRPDRGDREDAAEERRRGEVADGDHPPGRRPRRQHGAAERVEDDHKPRGVEKRIENALDSRLRQVERVEGVGEGPEPEQGQKRKDQHRPGRGDGAAEARRLGAVGIRADVPPRRPVQRNGDRRQEHREAAEAEQMARRDACADAGEPAADQRRHHPGIDRDFARHALPELWIEDARGPGEGLAREEFAPPRADPGRIVVDLQQHGARRAQIGVERVVLRLLALELRARGVVGGRSVLGRRRAVLGFRGELRQPLDRSREPRGHVGDRRLQGDAERVVLGAQALQVRVGQARAFERSVDRGERRARRVEIERMRVLRHGPAGRRSEDKRRGEDKSENRPAQALQDRTKRHAERRTVDSRRRQAPFASEHGGAAAATRSPAKAPVHLRTRKGLRRSRGFVKGNRLI